VLLEDSFGRRARKERLHRELVEHHLKRRRCRHRMERQARLRGYAIGWCHNEALRMDRARTIRLELERLHREHLSRKVVRFMQGGQVG
jgi:hypothetical protein